MKSDRFATTSGSARSIKRGTARFTVAMCTVFALQCALAQSASSDCNDVVTAAQNKQAAEKAALDAQEQLSNQAIENAKACIDRLMQLIRNMSPTLPSLQAMTIQQIVDYLSNRICSVATAQVQNTLGPIAGAVQTGINGAVQPTIGQVIGAGGGVISTGSTTVGGAIGTVGTGIGTIGGAIGGGVADPGSGGGGTISPTVPTPTTSSTSTSSSIMQRLGCVFGSGSGC